MWRRRDGRVCACPSPELAHRVASLLARKQRHVAVHNVGKKPDQCRPIREIESGLLQVVEVISITEPQAGQQFVKPRTNGGLSVPRA